MELKKRNKVMFFLGLLFAIIGGGELVAGIVTLVMILMRVLEGATPGDGLKFVCIFMWAQGVIFFTLGIIFVLAEGRDARKKKRLEKTGERYDAEITGSYYNTNVSVNGRNPLVVECRYRNRQGETCLVKSGSVWERNIAEEDMRAVVYVNPEKPRDYYVELSLNESAYPGGVRDYR